MIQKIGYHIYSNRVVRMTHPSSALYFFSNKNSDSIASRVKIIADTPSIKPINCSPFVLFRLCCAKCMVEGDESVASLMRSRRSKSELNYLTTQWEMFVPMTMSVLLREPSVYLMP